MPQHVAPPIRAREEFLETEGLLPVMDSVAVAQLKLAETAGTKTKIVPFNYTLIIRGKVYKAT